jgi:hypothetical protein
MCLVRGLQIPHQRMNSQRRTINEIVKATRDGSDEEISVVLCSDGSYGIARAGQLIESLRWPQEELAASLDFLERFARTQHFDEGQV